jgi:hypothetical protein
MRVSCGVAAGYRNCSRTGVADAPGPVVTELRAVS